MSLNLSKGDNLFLKRMIIVSCNSCCLVKAGANTYFYRDLKSPFIKSWCTECILNFFQSYFFNFLITGIIGIQDSLHVTHIYLINFVKGVNPPMSKAHCRCTSFHKYVITIHFKFRFTDLKGQSKI